MSQWKLPVIDSKKQFGEEQDYNFVNKDKKKSKDQTGALSMIEDLKHKIEQQKKQIDNRNATIMGLQRNFESLSAIVKNEKAQSAALKAQLQNLRQNSETGDKRALEFHQKSILLQNQNKMMREQLANLKRTHAECSKISIQCETYKNKIIQLQTVVDRYSQRLDALNQQKKMLQIQFNKARSQEKVKRQLQERIIDLQQQLKKSMDYNNSLNDKLKLQEDRLYQAKSGSSNHQTKIAELLKKLKQEENRKRSVESECQALRKEIRERHRQIQDLRKNADSMDLYSKMRQQQQEKFKEELKSSKIKCEQLKHEVLKLNEDIEQLKRDSNRKSQTLKVSQKQLQSLRQQNIKIRNQFKEKESKYLGEVERLTKWVGDLNNELGTYQGKNKQLYSKLNQQSSAKLNTDSKLKGLQSQLEDLNQRMQNQQKYSKYFKKIDENEAKGVVITNNAEMERITKGAARMADQLHENIDEQKRSIEQMNKQISTMKKYINSLQSQVNFKSKQINEKSKIIRGYEQKLDNLQDEQRKLAETIAQQRRKTEQYKKQSEQVLIKSQKQIEEERHHSQKKIEEEQKKAQKYKKLLQEYQQEQEKLKKLMSKQQDQIKLLAKSKEEEISQIIKQKQMEIQKQRKNNKLLWTDNKKLKDMEQKMREQALQQIEQIENRKKQEIQRLKKELEKRYEQNLDLKKQQQSNSNELKKILQEKAQQIKTITENHTKTRNQLQFYKNRNKELQGVVSRTEKAFKQQIATLEKDVKASKEVISVLDKKNTQINLVKQQIQRKSKSDIDKLTQQLSYLKQKYEGQRIEQKLTLLKKSIQQFETTLKAIANSLSCNYCLQPVKQCIRLKDCGHIYCKKCKGGYQPNCGECKKSSQEMNDKIIDDTISKSEYMKIIINTVKEDLQKISL